MGTEWSGLHEAKGRDLLLIALPCPLNSREFLFNHIHQQFKNSGGCATLVTAGIIMGLGLVSVWYEKVGVVLVKAVCSSTSLYAITVIFV